MTLSVTVVYGFLAGLVFLLVLLSCLIFDLRRDRSAQRWALAALSGALAMLAGPAGGNRLGLPGLVLCVVLAIASNVLLLDSLAALAQRPAKGWRVWCAAMMVWGALLIGMPLLPGPAWSLAAAALGLLLLNGWVLVELQRLRSASPIAGLSLMMGATALVVAACVLRLLAVLIDPQRSYDDPSLTNWFSQATLLAVVVLRFSVYLAVRVGVQGRQTVELADLNQGLQVLLAERDRLLDAVSLRMRVGNVDDLAADLVGELRLPINRIVEQADRASTGLAAAAGDPAVAETIIGLQASAHRAADILHGLCSFFAPPEALPTDRVGVELDSVLAELMALLQAEAALRQVHLELGGLPAGLRVHGVRVQIRQILLNLLSNAVRAAAGAPASRWVRLGFEIDAHRQVHLRISDSGPGFKSLPQDGLRRIFETSSPHGLGVGLWLSEQLAAANGGALQIANAPSGGACATLSLRLAGPAEIIS